jgi:serine/threonine protein kinase
MTNDNLLGNYEIQEKIGAGGMASVYKAYQPKLDRHVAIKVMHPNIAADTNFIARFEREARIVARLDHPNIVPIYDYDEVEGQPYLVMKYVEGRTLKAILRDGPLEPARVMHVITAVGDALSYAHDEGILHRDIKPSNIILSQRGNPYLMDFGLARIARSGESTMSADVMLGTPHYISPEQARGNTDLDERTDVYSFGVVLYELLTGRVPFVGDTSYAIIHDQLNTAPPSPRTFNPAIPESVEAVLMKALAKDRTDRYATPQAMVQAYKDALHGQTVAAPVSQIAPKEETPPAAAHEEDFITRVKRGAEVFGANMEAWGREMEQQFSDFDENMPKDERDREAWRRMKQAWKDAQAKKKAEDAAQKSQEKKKRSMSVEVNVGNNDDDESNVSHLTPEERIRRRIEKRMNKQQKEVTELAGHIVAFFVVTTLFCNLQGIIAGLSAGEILRGPGEIFAYLWAMGLIIHFITTMSSYGPGYQRRQRQIEEEVARQMSMSQSIKRKNDQFSHADDRAVRLTGEGEFTDSFVDEIEERRNQSS